MRNAKRNLRGEPETPDNHQRFPSRRHGVQAHLDHLARSACRPGFPKADGETTDPGHVALVFDGDRMLWGELLEAD